MMDNEIVDICPGLFLVGGVADRPEGYQRQDSRPKAVKEPPQDPDTAVGWMTRSAIDKAKGVETMMGEAGNRTAETRKEGRGKPEVWNSGTWWKSVSLHATSQLVRLRNSICE